MARNRRGINRRGGLGHSLTSSLVTRPEKKPPPPYQGIRGQDPLPTLPPIHPWRNAPDQVNRACLIPASHQEISKFPKSAVFRKLKVENRIQLANLVSNLRQRQAPE